jgi:hypothetical protein
MIRLTIAEQQDQTTWSVEGAQAAVAYLQRWLASQDHAG